MIEPKYVIVFATGDGRVTYTNMLDDVCSVDAKKEIRRIFAETKIADFVLIWRYDNGPITKNEQNDIARCIRDAVTPGLTPVPNTTPVRGGKFGRKYVDSESCMIMECDELRLPDKYTHWRDFVLQCRLNRQTMMRNDMSLDDIHVSPYGGVQNEREADPGYMEQLKEHATRHGTIQLSELPKFSGELTRQCIRCVKKGNTKRILTILAKECRIPPPKTSTSVSKYPLSYAFYDTASRTIVLMPKSVASTEGDILGIIAGFYRYLAHHHGWRFNAEPRSSLNYELNMTSDIATAMASMLSSHVSR